MNAAARIGVMMLDAERTPAATTTMHANMSRIERPRPLRGSRRNRRIRRRWVAVAPWVVVAARRRAPASFVAGAVGAAAPVAGFAAGAGFGSGSGFTRMLR